MRESAIVLCGGRSTRLGRDKAALAFGEETLLARVVRLVGEAADEVLVVAREGQVLPEPRGAHAAATAAAQAAPPAEPYSRARIVRDAADGLGPLAGIAAGLAAIRGERALVVACDMPLLRPALARRMLQLARDAAALVPVLDGYPVPTCAVYARGAAARARELVAARELRPRVFLESIGARYVPADELRDADPELESFLDCDTEHEYQAALRAAGLVGSG
jgi:molybdopterin-guanine dinucleotide biosynthesis protein A